MKAVVVKGPNEMSLEEVDMPRCGPQDVLIETRRTGICATDLKILHGLMPQGIVTYPCIPGHEFSGTVAATGDEVIGLATGERVVAEGRVPCRQCPRCLAGDTNLCETNEQIGFTRAGACAEYVLAPRHVVHRIPDHLSFEGAALIEPASTVFRAIRKLALRPGAAIGIIGVGTLGSLALKLVQSYEPGLVCAYGIQQEELERAKRLCAEHTIDASGSDPLAATLEFAPEGLDVVIEAAGSTAAVESAFRLVRSGGRIALLGSPGTGQTVSIDADALMRRDATVFGCLSYTSSDWTQMLELLATGTVIFDDLVEELFSLDRFARAFAALERPATQPKVMLEFP